MMSVSPHPDSRPSRVAFAHGSAEDDVEEVYYDVRGAAEYIGCTTGHLKNMRRTGEGPNFSPLFRRKGIRYSRSDIDRWKRERRFGSTTEYPEHFR
jgi:hypothetical protein